MTATEKTGIAWWNNLTQPERRDMFARALLLTGRDCSPAETFRLWMVGELQRP